MHSAHYGFIGVVHLPPMPGDPLYKEGGFSSVMSGAMRDAEALVRGGVDGIIIENYGSTPFPKGMQGSRIPPHQTAAMTLVAQRVTDTFSDVRVGVNCLRNDVMSALGIAVAAGLGFVRVNVHTGAYVTDQGLIEGEASESLRYRKALGGEDVAILADVLVKHASPLVPTTATLATQDCLWRGHADGVIVTGAATGAPISKALLEEVRNAAREAPVVLGSGVTPDTARVLAPFADGAIVGTWLKENGDVHAPVDADRVRRLGDILRPQLRGYKP